MLKIAISTHKGGAGKTVTAINLAAGLSRAMKTLLIDLDPQGHATLGLGVNVSLGSPTISDVLQDQRMGMEKIIHPVTKNLFLAPANIHLARVAETLYAGVRREERLGMALSKVRGFDLAVIDCPPSLGTLTINALACANWILVPCEMGARAADGLVDLLEIVTMLKGADFDRWRIVLTKFDIRKSVTNEAVLKGLEPYRRRIIRSRVGISEALNQAQITGKDIFHFEPNGRGAKFYRDLAGEIMALTQKKEAIRAI